MSVENVSVNRAPKRHLFLKRGESIVAVIGMSLVAILVLAMGAAGFLIFHLQRKSMERSRVDQVTAVAELIARTSERMLTMGDLTPTRRLIMDSADRYRFSRCCIVLPDGEVIADAEADRINYDLIDLDWSGDIDDEPTVSVSGGLIVVEHPIHIAGHGQAILKIQALTSPDDPLLMWETQAGVGGVGVAALLALLLVYRYFRYRMQAVSVIRESLIAMARGERAEGALAVAPNLGDEARAWNTVLAEHERFRKQVEVEKAQQSLNSAASGGSEIMKSCDALSQGLILVDDRQRVKYANNAAAVYLKAQCDKMIGQPIEKFIEQTSVLESIHTACEGAAKRRSTHEIDFNHESGAGVFRFSVYPIRHENAAVTMVVVEDITQQRVAERSRHEFVAQATHELRTPLTNIRLYVETALEDGEGDPTIRFKALNVINQESRRLERMVGDMLSVAEIESGSLQIRRDDVHLDEMLHDIQNDYQEQAKEKGIQLIFEMPPKLSTIQADRDKLMLAIHNLVGNALKYTPQSGRVTVTVEESPGRVKIEVTDTGIGISPDDQERVFDKFYRARDKRITGITGSGLGLALAREIVRLHGGDIAVESQLDKGSQFILTLPH